MPAASSIHAIERNRAAPSGERGQRIARQLAAEHLERVAIRTKRVKPPHQQIEHPIARTLVGVGCRGGAARTVSSMRRKKAHRIAGFDGNVR